MKPFRNEKYTDFTKPENRKKMEKTLAEVEAQFGREYDLIIGGARVKTSNKLISYNPSKKDQVVGVFQKADEKIAEQAMESALETFKTWQYTPAKVRANYLFKMADIMRKRRLELDAWLVFEAGKNWVEADADIAEAIMEERH